VMLRNLDDKQMTDDRIRPSVHRLPSIIQVSRPAALLGAVVFMFNDFFITHIGNPNMVAVGAWLPLVFLFFQRALSQRRVFFALLAGAVTGMAYLAGHIQPFLYILFVVGWYAVYGVLTGKRVDEETRKRGVMPFISSSTRLLVYPSTCLLVYLLFTI